MTDLIAYLSGDTRPGDVISLSIIRDGGERLELSVTLGTRPQ
jgi:S1-C subfamily serine protease